MQVASTAVLVSEEEFHIVLEQVTIRENHDLGSANLKLGSHPILGEISLYNTINGTGAITVNGAVPRQRLASMLSR